MRVVDSLAWIVLVSVIRAQESPFSPTVSVINAQVTSEDYCALPCRECLFEYEALPRRTCEMTQLETCIASDVFEGFSLEVVLDEETLSSGAEILIHSDKSTSSASVNISSELLTLYCYPAHDSMTLPLNSPRVLHILYTTRHNIVIIPDRDVSKALVTPSNTVSPLDQSMLRISYRPHSFKKITFYHGVLTEREIFRRFGPQGCPCPLDLPRIDGSNCSTWDRSFSQRGEIVNEVIGQTLLVDLGQHDVMIHKVSWLAKSHNGKLFDIRSDGLLEGRKSGKWSPVFAEHTISDTFYHTPYTKDIWTISSPVSLSAIRVTMMLSRKDITIKEVEATVSCQCNNLTLQCGVSTDFVCQECLYNTDGDQCEACLPGFYAWQPKLGCEHCECGRGQDRGCDDHCREFTTPVYTTTQQLTTKRQTEPRETTIPTTKPATRPDLSTPNPTTHPYIPTTAPNVTLPVRNVTAPITDHITERRTTRVVTTEPETNVTSNLINTTKPQNTTLPLTKHVTARRTTEVHTTEPELPTTAQKVETTAPKVQTTAPKVQTTAPKVLTTSPKVQTTAPKVQTTAPKILTEAPKVQTTAPKILTEAPKVQTTAPKVLTEAPKVQTTAPTTTPGATTWPPTRAYTGGTEPNLETVVRKAENKASKVETEPPKVETKAPKVETVDHEANVNEVEQETAARKVETNAHEVETKAPKVETMAPKVETKPLKIETKVNKVPKTAQKDQNTSLRKSNAQRLPKRTLPTARITSENVCIVIRVTVL